MGMRRRRRRKRRIRRRRLWRRKERRMRRMMRMVKGDGGVGGGTYDVQHTREHKITHKRNARAQPKPMRHATRDATNTRHTHIYI